MQQQHTKSLRVQGRVFFCLVRIFPIFMHFSIESELLLMCA